MGLKQSVDVEGLTFGQLYRFVDHARAAGIHADTPVTVESEDNLGNNVGAHSLSVDLGEVDELTRPILIDRESARQYAEALYNELQQQSDKSDRDSLSLLLDDLWELPHKEEHSAQEATS